MGRITANVTVENVLVPDNAITVNALIDTGASYLTFPLAWKEKLGVFGSQQEIELQTATQEVVKGIFCGPVRITVEGFRPVHNDVLFLDMLPNKGEYEPLLGYIVLEQCGVSVDMSEHRLVPMKYMDVKFWREAKGKT
ncbi:MAG: Aspartyl protease [Candidatus Kentron sp. G]|nr:MAG: Aspartyl protease [Candidatus Kentron sp. G]VFN04663.1 MAG: Aspartyl protease [Candidatus Kentron sp. G]VFN06063.1 MAG: Aspartyl protease [Candidatus Kentron sp. G]